ncbi:MAG: peptidase C56 [Sphingomonas sp. SCN 67-18]|uniref:type 1 glutamine amidotransferase domain-containing protein n=1 Tax=uncultured Sphingomonas sp. TaxID=158754 RepID=UPI00086E7C0B|nr:type 1 glutamine amidotransferase domain-containing protein [Sphingomonas sp. SCN 67-18]ODU20477.1 MAG: peptidase C56 [Sphingomonas sp. SCN 67-18]
MAETPPARALPASALIVATDGFEQSELFKPQEALLAAGAEVTLASVTIEPIQGMEHDEKTRTITPHIILEDVHVDDYDALILPGGLINPDTLRMNPEAVEIVRAFRRAGKIIAAICHGPWMLVEADVIRGVTVTGWPSIRTDLRNAGAHVVDSEVVVDDNIITSRKPEDIPAFNDAILTALAALPERAAA